MTKIERWRLYRTPALPVTDGYHWRWSRGWRDMHRRWPTWQEWRSFGYPGSPEAQTRIERIDT